MDLFHYHNQVLANNRYQVLTNNRNHFLANNHNCSIYFKVEFNSHTNFPQI